jgi:hypothetical protein
VKPVKLNSGRRLASDSIFGMSILTGRIRRLDAVQKDILAKREARRLAKDRCDTIARAKTKVGKTWSDEEIAALLDLCEKFKGERYINVAISKHLHSKTPKQIGNKRKALKALYKSKPQHNSVEVQVSSKTNTEEARVLPQVDFDANAYRSAIVLDGNDLVGVAAECLLRSIEGEECEDVMSSLIERLTTMCSRNGERKKNSHKSRAKPNQRAQGKKARDKANRYRVHQRLFSKDKKALANLVLDGKEESQKCGLDPTLVEEIYRERFGGESQAVNLDKYPRATQVSSVGLLKPFTTDEIREGYRRAKKETAAGPDGIELK